MRRAFSCVALSCALGSIAAGCGAAEPESPPPLVVAMPLPAQSCPRKPEAATNPPIPAGWVQVQQPSVTAEMTAWATDLVKNGKAYPMCSSTTQAFGGRTVLARIEWHPPDFNVQAVHRGVTLYERAARPLGASLDLR